MIAVDYPLLPIVGEIPHDLLHHLGRGRSWHEILSIWDPVCWALFGLFCKLLLLCSLHISYVDHHKFQRCSCSLLTSTMLLLSMKWKTTLIAASKFSFASLKISCGTWKYETITYIRYVPWRYRQPQVCLGTVHQLFSMFELNRPHETCWSLSQRAIMILRCCSCELCKHLVFDSFC